MHWIKWITFVNIFMKNDYTNFAWIFERFFLDQTLRSEACQTIVVVGSLTLHLVLPWDIMCLINPRHIIGLWRTKCFVRTKLIISSNQIFLKSLNYFFVPYGWAYLNICLQNVYRHLLAKQALISKQSGKGYERIIREF